MKDAYINFLMGKVNRDQNNVRKVVGKVVGSNLSPKIKYFQLGVKKTIFLTFFIKQSYILLPTTLCFKFDLEL